MIDSRFYNSRQPLDVSEIEQLTGLEVSGAFDKDLKISHVAAPGHGELSGAAIFVTKPDILESLTGSAPALCCVSPKVAAKIELANRLPGTAILVCDNPKAIFAILAGELHQSLAEELRVPAQHEPEIDDSAIIHETAVIGANVKIGAGVRIGAYSVIGPGVEIGDETFVSAHVSLTHSLVGRRCFILAGARIGEAGFGFVQHNGEQRRVPQLGRVILGDEVEIGSNTTVDRGMLADTVIGTQSKIDNLVQVAHNVCIGERCAIASQTGISGSTIIGDDVMIGGQAGIADHLSVGDRAIVIARAALLKDVPADEKWAGYPAKPSRQWFREVAAVTKLAETKSKKRS